jgi:predicted metal-binding protein
MEKKVRLSKDKRKGLETLFQEHGFLDFKWIKPENIVVSQWVRMKCTFGCGEYARNATCPPNVPTVAECERFFKEYTDAAVFHFEKKVAKPEDRHVWSRKLNMKLSKLEREVFLSGYERAFLLFMDSCCICKECSGERGKCKVPRSARPSPESMAMDVFSTVKRIGYPIEPLTDYTQAMNRYAFLMVA